MKRQPRPATDIPDPGRASGYFAALKRTKPTAPPVLTRLATLFENHHAITHQTPLADVVVACACSPNLQRNAAGWSRHLIEVIGRFDTSGATVPVGQAPVEEAGACRVIPITRK